MNVTTIPDCLQKVILESIIKKLERLRGIEDGNGGFIVHNLLDCEGEELWEATNQIIYKCVGIMANKRGQIRTTEVVDEIMNEYFTEDIKILIHENIIIPLSQLWNETMDNLMCLGDQAEENEGILHFLTEQLTYRSKDETINYIKDTIHIFYEDEFTCFMKINEVAEADERDYTILHKDDVNIPDNITELYWEKYDEINKKENNYLTDPTQIIDVVYCPVKPINLDGEDDDVSWKSLTAEIWSTIIIDECIHTISRKMRYYIENLENTNEEP